MDQMVTTLTPYLDNRDVIGYAAARNVRIFRNELVEYYNYRDELIKKYGKKELDKNGNFTGRYYLDGKSDNINQYAADMSEFSIIEHDVNVFKIPFEKACDILTGNQILELEWMFED